MKRPREQSLLHRMLQDDAASFFDDTWGKAPQIFRCKGVEKPPLYNFGDVLAVLKNTCKSVEGTMGSDAAPSSSALIMKNGCPTKEYGNSFAAAYLDGCSVVVNHIEAASEDVRQLCVDLREDFPHAYVNAYLTPPEAQAVAPHADDRDVMVLQTAGKKKWKVYRDPPTPFPFTLEQVGKYDECPVPDALLAAPPLLEVTLEPGDILYLPRGYVHEAFTGQDPSLHLTIALATHDWCWSRVAGRALALSGMKSTEVHAFTQEVEALDPEQHLWRHSIPPCLVCDGGVATEAQRAAARKTLATMMLADPRMARLTSAGLLETLSAQVAVHNRRQDGVRPPATAEGLTQDSFIRRLTEEEKEKREKEKAATRGTTEGSEEGPAGLVARDEIADVLMAIIAACSTTPIAVKDFQDAPDDQP